MNKIVTPKFGVGASVRRIEDNAFITGKGCFVSDVSPDGVLHGYVLRSPIAHARLKIDGLADARAADGVHLVLIGEDLKELGDLPCVVPQPQIDGTPPKVPPRRPLAEDIVRHVGEPVAFIVADSVNAAKSASELLDIDWQPLDVIVGSKAAMQSDAPVIWPEFGSNQAFEFGVGDKEATEKAFANATQVTELKIVNNRIVTNYMETRGCIGEFDGDTGRYTLTATTQGGHSVRGIIAGSILKIPESDLRIVTHDVGGGFGTKVFVSTEYVLVCVAAKRLGRPVKWIGERSDHFLGDSQGRDNVTTARLAMDADDKILALQVDVLADIGAYLNQFAPFIPFLGLTMSTGVYDIPLMYARAVGVYTNTLPVDAYRGAGRPEACFVIERLVNQAGIDTGLGPIEIRRRNFIPPSAMPYTTPAGRMYDVGEFDGHLQQALENAGWSDFETRAAESRSRGRIRGIGLSTYVEACAFAGSEAANLELNNDGTVTLLIGTQSNGQGHATSYGQVVADHLGIDLADINFIQGDTDRVKTGGGTGGSRSIPLGLPSVEIASKSLVEKIKKLAGAQLEAAEVDLELADGAVRVAGTDQQITLADIATGSTDPDETSASGLFEQTEATYPNGTHICEVEIDPETGVVTITAYTAVDDYGVMVNPLLLAGQVHGGIIQGSSQALMEYTYYDEDGQLLSASFMDYCMPRAGDFPWINFETRNVPSTTNMMGIKGAGEAGTIGATPAVANAIVDALHRAYGITNYDMPATPHRIWQKINSVT